MLKKKKKTKGSIWSHRPMERISKLNPNNPRISRINKSDCIKFKNTEKQSKQWREHTEREKIFAIYTSDRTNFWNVLKSPKTTPPKKNQYISKWIDQRFFSKEEIEMSKRYEKYFKS